MYTYNYLQRYKSYYKIPTLIHRYNTRQDTVQQHMTIHAFADNNCLHAMIALINKHPIVKLIVATSKCNPSFVRSVKHDKNC